MNHNLIQQMTNYIKKNTRQRKWQKVVTTMAAIVVFVTTYALILPAITMERDAYCGIMPHAHDASCYVQVTTTEEQQLICTISAHVHSDECWEVIQGNLICTEVVEVPHEHTDVCNGEVKNLICQEAECAPHAHEHGCFTTPKVLTCMQEETSAHSHSDSCWTTEKILICEKEETDGHAHGETCLNEAGELICTLDEQEAHQHGAACYTDSEPKHICGVEGTTGHAHEDACYSDGEPVVSCGFEETMGHTHSDACYEVSIGLVCTTEMDVVHEHVDECYTWNDTLICTLEEADLTQAIHEHTDICYESVEVPADIETLTCTAAEAEHEHTALCYGTWNLTCTEEVHEHELQCYADFSADVETAAIWEQTFADVELTGNAAKDAVAIAKTQIGYTESTENYLVQEDGETIKGYTRYGSWYGEPYADWCAMFVSFCLHYGGAEDFPLDAGCDTWIAKLSAEGLYRTAGSYTPKTGDVVFYDYGGDGSSDHVGLVAEIDTVNNQLIVIEGNAENTVKYVTYAMNDTAILGYGWQLAPLDAEAQARVDAVIDLIDAMPSADEIDVKIEEFEAAEDYEGEEAWYTEVVQQVADVYAAYSELSEEEKLYVLNADKLLELEYIWSQAILIEEINSAAPTVGAYTSTKDFIELNLYDYNYNINQWWFNNNKYPGFQWNGGAYGHSDYKYSNSSADAGIPNYTTDRNRVDSIDFGNSMITNFNYGNTSNYAKSVNSVAVGKLYNNSGASSTGKINWLWYDGSDYGTTTNRPVGMSTGYQSLSNTLINGYPALLDGTSLSYLFGDEAADQHGAVTKQNSSSIDGLFLQNTTTGAYSYNSRENHAQYSNNFFTRYNQIITPNFIVYPFGNFLPLNTITDRAQATQVGAFNRAGGMKTYVDRIIADLKAENATVGTGDWKYTTRTQLITMLEEYAENWDIYTDNGTWSDISPANAIRDYFQMDGDNPSDDVGFVTQAHLDRMYNIDWDVDTNFFFGMEMKMNFMQPKGGVTGNDTNKDGESDYPMVFYFTGDDDVWVYIDGVLFLDLSGIHRHVGGQIDFVNGKVHYYELSPAIGDVSSTPYKTYTFAELLTAAGKSTDGLNSNGTFKDYTTHSFNFYYIERGSGSSVCRINFNFPLLRQNSISVSKEVASDVEIYGNPDYKFQVLKADSNGNKTETLFIGAGISYTIYDANDQKIGTGTTDANGVFTLKAGQRAEFTGIKENAGKYYVRELLEGTVLEQYGNITVSGASTTTSNNVTIGSDTFTGMDSPVKDMSDGATAFRFTNDVDEKKVGKLNISKAVQEYPTARVIKYYDIEVTLDGTKLPVGTTYTVGSETRTVQTEGIITIAADETATIDNILAGTKFVVQETSGSAEGYTVTYSEGSGYTVDTSGGSISGVITTSADVKIKILNAEKGTSVTIPGTKHMAVSDGNERTYTFVLSEVTDSTGTTLKEGGIADYRTTATVANGTETFEFVLNYAQVDQAGLPATFYYKITEESAANTMVNNTVYVAEVTVSKTEDGITAAVTKMHKDGVEASVLSADFVNTLVGDLSLSKTVVAGSDTQSTQGFTFTVELNPGTSGVQIAESYAATFYQQDGTVAQTTVKCVDGVITLREFMHGETAVIHGIPFGATWKITETDADGFTVTTQVGSGDVVTGTETTGGITVGTTEVSYTNTMMYELPETGGMGTHLYIMAGLLLMVCSSALLMYRYKKRRREDA